MNIRDAIPADLPFLIEGLEKNRASDQRVVETSTEDTHAFENGISQKTVRIAEDSGKAIGFAFFRTDMHILHMQPPFLWLDLVYVKDEWRGKGVGTALLKDVQIIAKSKSMTRIILDIFAINQPSWDFHNKHGFEPVYTIFEKII